MLRRAGDDDVDAIADVVVAVAPEGTLGAEPPVDTDAVRQRARGTVTGGGPSAAWVLVDDDGAVAGYLSLPESRTSGVFGIAMALLPAARGRGLGRALVDVALAHARSLGAHKVELEVWPDNARAIALYTAAGFEVEGVRRRHYRRRDGSLRSALLMAAHLPDTRSAG